MKSLQKDSPSPATASGIGQSALLWKNLSCVVRHPSFRTSSWDVFVLFVWASLRINLPKLSINRFKITRRCPYKSPRSAMVRPWCRKFVQFEIVSEESLESNKIRSVCVFLLISSPEQCFFDVRSILDLSDSRLLCLWAHGGRRYFRNTSYVKSTCLFRHAFLGLLLGTCFSGALYVFW